MQHLGFAVSGLVFWWSLLRSGRDGLAVLCLFASFMHTGLLYPEQTALAGQFFAVSCDKRVSHVFSILSAISVKKSPHERSQMILKSFLSSVAHHGMTFS